MTELKRRHNFTAEFIETGKLQPQAPELEEAVLGAILLEKDAYDEIYDILLPECFYKEAHVIIYRAIADMVANLIPVDLLTVTAELRKKGELDLVGGPFYVTELTSRVASSGHIKAHAQIIYEKYVLREEIRIASEVSRLAFEAEADPFDITDHIELALQKLNDERFKGNMIPTWNEQLREVRVTSEEAAKNKGITGVPSRFGLLNRILGGYQDSDFIILAARPSMGKTALALNEAVGIALKRIPVAVFSLEMSRLQLNQRLVSSESEIALERIKYGKFDEDGWKHYHSKLNSLRDLPIFIDDTPALSVADLRSKCRRLKNKHKIQIIVIDYLQLMRGDTGNKNGNREQEVSYISRSIKSLAKELNVPIIALAQLSREVEKRPDKKPMLSDLRESGSLEQDADVVLFLYRPEYYGVTEDSEGNDIRGLAKVLIAKHRNGSLGDIKLRFNPEFTKFDNHFNSSTDDEILPAPF